VGRLWRDTGHGDGGDGGDGRLGEAIRLS
jgi:hypothetical protein